MHHPRCASASLEARLGNPSLTHFQTKEATRSRRVSRAIFILPSILWCNRQTIAHLVLMPKLKKPSRWFSRLNHQTAAVGFEAQTDPSEWFWGQTTRTIATGFETKSRETVNLGFEAKLRNLLSLCPLCAVQTTHNVIWPLDRPTIEYPSCAWPSLVLCTKSPTPTTILVAACHVTPVTYTSWEKHTRFSTRNR
jgi:hypothetical protein